MRRALIADFVAATTYFFDNTKTAREAILAAKLVSPCPEVRTATKRVLGALVRALRSRHGRSG